MSEHWNYGDDKNVADDYIHMNQGRLQVEWASARTGPRGPWSWALADGMAKRNHMVGLEMVGQMMPQERNTMMWTNEEHRQRPKAARVTDSWCANDRALIAHSFQFMGRPSEASEAKTVWRQPDGTGHLAGTVRVGDDRRSSVVDADRGSRDVPNPFVCDGSVFPATGGVNPSLTIQALARRGEP